MAALLVDTICMCSPQSAGCACVLIRIRLFFIVCPCASFDHRGKTVCSRLESDGLGWNVITLFYSASLRPSPSFFCLQLKSSIPVSLIPKPPFSFFCLFLRSSFTIISDHLKILPQGNCFLFSSRATDTIGFALTSSLVLQSSLA